MSRIRLGYALNEMLPEKKQGAFKRNPKGDRSFQIQAQFSRLIQSLQGETSWLAQQTSLCLTAYDRRVTNRTL